MPRVVCGTALLAGALSCFAAGQPEVRLEGNRFVARGWPQGRGTQEEWRQVFAVFVDGDAAGAPPLLGSYKLAEGALVFEPRFPLEPGVRYKAVLRTDPVTVARFEIPRTPVAAARVEAVFPSAGRLPENLLKFYLHFSAPMSRGDVYRHVRLLDGGGRTVELPFLELEQELWDPGAKRLTLLFDPGRIKRGLVPNREAGAALKAGQRYTLVIDAGWQDANGAPLLREFRKEFVAGGEDRAPPDPRAWGILPPAAGSRAPLVVTFPEPMDRALLETLLTVLDRGGTEISGQVSVGEQERIWQFLPDEAWKAGRYSLGVDTALEDLAGNRIGRPFDVDLFERVERQIRREIRFLPFAVR